MVDPEHYDHYCSRQYIWGQQSKHRVPTEIKKTQFHDFSMIFHDQQCNFHDFLMHGLHPHPLLAASSPGGDKCGMQQQKSI